MVNGKGEIGWHNISDAINTYIICLLVNCKEMMGRAEHSGELEDRGYRLALEDTFLDDSYFS